MVTVHPIDTIVSDPEVRQGQPLIEGNRIRVIDIVARALPALRGLLGGATMTNCTTWSSSSRISTVVPCRASSISRLS